MLTFTQLIGTTSTSSPSTYGTACTTLANNNSAIAVAFFKAQAQHYHRYLLEKYFDNERTFSMPVVGGQNITFTGSLAVGATSATLSSAWTKMSCSQFVNFSSGDQRMCKFINGSTGITWDSGLASTATTAASTVGVRDYPIPANISKVINDTVTVGQLVFQPAPVQSRQEWDTINTLPYTSDIPNYFFIYGGTLGIWPIPSTTNNPLNFNYKTRVPDLTFDDYSTGHIANGGMSAGSYQVTGTGTTWSANFPLNTDVSYFNLMLRVDPPYGDGIWYPISSFQSDTALTLALPVVNAPNITSSATYTIGQVPLLQEDFHDAIIYGCLMSYYGTIVKDVERYKMFAGMYETRLKLMDEYLGTKSVNVDLEDVVNQMNANLFLYKQS